MRLEFRQQLWRQPDPQRAHGVGEDAVAAVTFQGQDRLGRQFAAGVPGTAQPAEPLLADGEHDGHRPRTRPGELPFGDGHGGRHGDRVVPDPRAAQPAVAPCDAALRGLVEDVVDVNEHGQAVRRRTERPHQVADPIDVPAPGSLLKAPLQPVDAHLLVPGPAVQFGQRHGIRGDRRRVERRLWHVT